MCNCSQKQQFYPYMGGVLFAKNLSDFRLSLRSEVRRYWSGDVEKGDFIFNFNSAIERGFRRAFRIGAAECGIKPESYTDEMRSALQRKINEQFIHILSMANGIVAKIEKGKLGDAFRKIEIWIARYGELKQLGTVLACGNEKLKWVLGAAEHCKSCVKLSGKVKLASFWNKKGILPRVAGASYLDCKGYNCKCSLVPTNDPISKGSLPSLP